MRLYLKRKEEDKIRKIKAWTLIYGRRKTGKTTLVKKYIKADWYFLVTVSLRAVTRDDKVIKLEDALNEAKRVIRSGGTAIIDEFQRLPDDFYIIISNWEREGILVAVGSSYGVLEKVFDRNSPLLGMFTPMEIDIISYEDVLYQLGDPLLSVIFRDPWIIPFIDKYEELLEKVKEFSLVAKGLIGEVFKEEERQLTNIYYKILLLLGEGIWKTSEIAGIIQPKGGEPTISSMVNKLAKMGLVQKIPTLSRENFYKIRSPPLSLILYAESKYSVSETELKVETLPIGREVQFSIGEMLAKYFNGELYYSPKEDIDIVIMKKRVPIWGFEVKMGEITRSEALNAVKRISKVAKNVGLISLREKPPEGYADLSLGPDELKEIAGKLFNNS
ncbi:AAA family ATPase [Acidianus sp. RZ1]|uniref:AAA family ATPase n=1 Tax=Acidianus sp. RZ1 TaxID=1540082 RepID=UPI00149245F1|nr:AAA family ATPase [Acidianus sp. RZ1]NON63530.1 ATP-binding protein [Acidianus sp. RZ1]